MPALRLRDGTAWASDAGEPAGSAGAPLLAVLEGAALADVACVVVRWFGGVKLGVGGLVRAYGDALRAALDGARRSTRHGRRAAARCATGTTRPRRSCGRSRGTARARSSTAYTASSPS